MGKKKEKKDTLNFLIKKTLKPDVYDLYLQGPNNIVKHGIACIPNLKCSQMLRSMFEETIDEQDLCVECRYYKKQCKWQPLHKSKEPMSKIDDV